MGTHSLNGMNCTYTFYISSVYVSSVWVERIFLMIPQMFSKFSSDTMKIRDHVDTGEYKFFESILSSLSYKV